MKYLLMVYVKEDAYTPDERQHCCDETVELLNDLSARGQIVSVSPLESVNTATSVRVRKGEPLVTAGPFAETREQLAGYFLVDVKDLNEAIAIAGRIPGARKGAIEVRPLFELAGLPKPALRKSHATA